MTPSPGWAPHPSSADPPAPQRLSPSALGTYRRCPRRFWFQYVLRMRLTQPPTASLLLGQAVHLTLATLYQLPVGRRDEQMAGRLLRQAWRRQPRDKVFLSREEEAGWGHRALSMLADYCAGWDLRVRPLALEEWVTAMLPGGSMQVFGKTDRIDAARAGDGVEIVDYKTGQLSPEREPVQEQLAARLYALAAWRTYGQPVHRVRFIWLAEPHEASWYPELEDLQAAEQELLELATAIQAEREWSARPGTQCRFCPFAPHCDGREEAQDS
jgi:RecB family exonuclease